MEITMMQLSPHIITQLYRMYVRSIVVIQRRGGKESFWIQSYEWCGICCMKQTGREITKLESASDTKTSSI